MKLANVDGRATIVRNETGIDVEHASDGRFSADIHSLYEEWAAFKAFADGCTATADVEIDDKLLGAPAPRPRQVFAIGVNYRAHAAESGVDLPDVPATFTKFPACITGPFDAVALPSAVVDWEVELVVVIGAHARRVSATDAWSHVAGLTVGQDLSERVVQFAAAGQFSLGKSFEGFGPTGPWLVTPDELDNPDDLGLGCAVDGVTMQDARTSDMVFSVARADREALGDRSPDARRHHLHGYARGRRRGQEAAAVPRSWRSPARPGSKGSAGCALPSSRATPDGAASTDRDHHRRSRRRTGCAVLPGVRTAPRGRGRVHHVGRRRADATRHRAARQLVELGIGADDEDDLARVAAALTQLGIDFEQDSDANWLRSMPAPTSVSLSPIAPRIDPRRASVAVRQSPWRNRASYRPR